MNHIFTPLAWFAVLLFAATLVIGLSLGDIRHDPSEQAIVWTRVHRLSGIAAALTIVLVNSLVVIYFIGTSRWCKEVAEAYNLDPQIVREANLLKRRTFPWALLAMLAVVAVTALGGAADPGTGRPHTDDWALPHLAGGFVGLLLIAWASVVQWNNINANHQLIDLVMAHVKRIRSERGLEN